MNEFMLAGAAVFFVVKIFFDALDKEMEMLLGFGVDDKDKVFIFGIALVAQEAPLFEAIEHAGGIGDVLGWGLGLGGSGTLKLLKCIPEDLGAGIAWAQGQCVLKPDFERCDFADEGFGALVQRIEIHEQLGGGPIGFGERAEQAAQSSEEGVALGAEVEIHRSRVDEDDLILRQ